MLILFTFLFFFSGNPPVEPANSFQELSMRIIEANSKKDFAAFSKLIPGTEEWKAFDPEQVKDLTEEEIKLKVEEGNLPRLKRQFDEVQEDARSRGVRIKDIVFNTVKVQRFSDDQQQAVKLEIMFYYDHKSGRFSVKAAEINSHWFLLDFKQEESPFKDIRVSGGNSLLKQMGF